MTIRIKICGLSTPEAVERTADLDADMAGFIFFAKSPRHVAIETAADLADRARDRGLETVAVSVDMDDAGLDDIVAKVKPDWLQLHGAESPERVSDLKTRHGLPVMKAFAIREAADLDRIARYGAAVAARLANEPEPPDFVRVERTGQEGGQMAIRIFTGTIPDYSSEVNGLMLSGVMAGGPAETAGLREGDIIVELAGQSITNIYDYTYALDLLKVGEPAAVAFMRDGEQIETELVPESRE